MSRINVDLFEMWPLISEVISSGGEFRLFPRGTSMMPLLREGTDSVVLVSPESVQKGDIAFYRRANGQFVLHRVIRIKKDEYLMCGDNQYIIEHGIKKENILAKVAHIYRGDELLPDNDRKYARYIFFLPSRRIKKRIRAMLSATKRKITKKKSEEQ